jgi:hypothetical protein
MTNTENTLQILAQAAEKADMAVGTRPDGIPYLYFVKGEFIGHTIAIALVPGRAGYQQLLDAVMPKQKPTPDCCDCGNPWCFDPDHR